MQILCGKSNWSWGIENKISDIIGLNYNNWEVALCSKMPINQASYQFCTVLVVNHYKYGIKIVLPYIIQVQNGHIKRLTDQDIQSSVLEIMGTNVTTAFITCPAN